MPELLTGTRECSWLDAKSQPYQLDQPRFAAELAKDVAALANNEGGVIVVGLRTRRNGSSEIIDEVRPVPVRLIDRDRYRKLVRERVFPFVRDFSTWWLPADDERGLLVIDVPAQASKDKPFIVSGSAGTQAAVNASSVAVPLRDDDGTHWLSGQELHRFLTEGWNVSGPPAPRVVVASSPAPPSAAVGEGDPLWSEEFREVYDAAGGRAAVGVPDGPVTPAGPGVMQQLSGDSRGPAAICAVPDFKPVILAGDVWRFFLKQSRDASPADYPALAGLPTADGADQLGRRIVRLTGGEWGAGELVQDGPGDAWRWRPVPAVDTTPALNADRWSWMGEPGTEPDLVIRADAFLPWRGATSWRIEKRGRERMRAALPGAALSRAMVTMARSCDIAHAPPAWEIISEREGGRQSERTAQYQCAVPALAGTWAVIAEARLILPNGFQYQSVQASAGLRIRLAGEAAAVGAADQRLSIAELVDVFLAAWETAMLVIPVALVEDPVAVPLAGPPRAELYVRAGERYVNGRPEYKELPQVMDLSPLGTATGTQLRQGGISVTAPLETGSDERRFLVRQAVARMAAGQWGFIEVGDDLDL